jgi:aspartate racemase
MGCVRHWENLVRHLGSDQPCFGLVPDRRGDWVETFPTLGAMADCFVSEIRSVQPEGPYAVAGYSFSGYLALEVAQQLISTGGDVSLVAVIESPGGPLGPLTVRNLLPICFAFVSNLPWWIWYDVIECQPVDIWERFLRRTRWLRRRLHKTPGRNHESNGADDATTIWNLEKVESTQRKLAESNCDALSAYRPRVYPGPISLFLAKARPLFHAYPQRDMGWLRLAGGGLRVDVISGDHASLLDEPYVQQLAQLVHDRLVRHTPKMR